MMVKPLHLLYLYNFLHLSYDLINVLYLVKYNDDDDLVNKINILAQDKDLCSKMGINARKKVEKDFANQIMIKKIIEIYNEIIDNKTN